MRRRAQRDPRWHPSTGAASRAAFTLAAAIITGAASAPAAMAADNLPMPEHNVVGLSLIVGLVLFSTITALLHLTGRKRWTQRETDLVQELEKTRSQLDRARVFLSAEPQIVIAWSSSTSEPDIEGDVTLVMDAPVPRRVLGFGAWLEPAAAQRVDQSVARLRERGEGFRMALVTNSGRHLEAEGRAIAGRAMLRIRDVSGDRMELISLRQRHAELGAGMDGLRAMLDAIADPAWMRDEGGRLTWVSAAYARAVEAQDGADAVMREIELLDRNSRDQALRALAVGDTWRARLPALVAGERHMLEAIDVPSRSGSVGIARDLNDIEAVRNDLERQMQSHARTLDQLATAVAIFDSKKRLIFHNTAYRHLWALEPTFLDQNPSDPEILERLRAEHRLPEQADFRAWRNGLMAVYQALEADEQVWYLPDSRTLRVVISPNPQGGVTYLFDDVSERFHLESQFNALIRVQGETLDSLKEGVAVFGTDGRLKLFNPAFTDLWHLEPEDLAGNPRFDALARHLATLCPDGEALPALGEVVTGLNDHRTGVVRRIARSDGIVLDSNAQPLPDGATLLTFIDVTAQVNVERALTDRNRALIETERLRNDFVHHVSYELRSPLTNIIGFTQLLSGGNAGALNDKQREYVGHVSTSSAALLAIINDILDLASIDEDAMELDLRDVDILGTMNAAALGVQDRLAESSVTLSIMAMDGNKAGLGSFRADSKRVRQILFNLLSNAIGFSGPGQSVTLAAVRRDDDVVFKVSDNGRGIPPEVLDRVFQRFESHTVGTRHRGVGLGLSIVRSLVELHGGRVLIDSAPGEGTTVTCIFPAQASMIGIAPSSRQQAGE